MDFSGQVLTTFTDVNWPRHLSPVSDGRVLVADWSSHSILLLNSQLKLEHVLVNINSQVKERQPARLCYDELTSQLYVVHSDGAVSIYSVHADKVRRAGTNTSK